MIPESPLWGLRRGRVGAARRALAWALMSAPEEISLNPATAEEWRRPRLRELLRYPRSLLAACLGNIGAVTGEYGIILWGPSLLVLVLHATPAHASALMVGVSMVGVAGRLTFGLLPLTAATVTMTMGTVSVFWLMLMVTFFFADGGVSINGPYSAELWPSRLRASGMGACYGFGSIGKIIGPLGLAMIAGSSNFIAPAAIGTEGRAGNDGFPECLVQAPATGRRDAGGAHRPRDSRGDGSGMARRRGVTANSVAAMIGAAGRPTA